jgi:hypothetical protein
MADVIEGSRETPVIVDFWATWCGPCKTLGPMLEAAVTAAKGKVRMVKIDVDKEQRLAVRWRSRACRCSRSRRSWPSSAVSPSTCSRARSRKARSTSS